MGKRGTNFGTQKFPLPYILGRKVQVSPVGKDDLVFGTTVYH